MGFFDFFGNRFKKEVKKGAVIIDVRPAGAFDMGRIPGSINIPLDRLMINVRRIKDMKTTIIICCEYGGDCEKAMRLLRSEGVKELISGGRWERLLKRLSD
jgi:rhodanese-related sulfurtransferase